MLNPVGVFVFVAASAHELVAVYGVATVLYFVVVYALGRVIATEEPAAVDEMYAYCRTIPLLKTNGHIECSTTNARFKIS